MKWKKTSVTLAQHQTNIVSLCFLGAEYYHYNALTLSNLKLPLSSSSTTSREFKKPNNPPWIWPSTNVCPMLACSGGSKGFRGFKPLPPPPPPQEKIVILFRGFSSDFVIYWVRNSAQYALNFWRKLLEIKNFPGGGPLDPLTVKYSFVKF